MWTAKFLKKYKEANDNNIVCQACIRYAVLIVKLFSERPPMCVVVHDDLGWKNRRVEEPNDST